MNIVCHILCPFGYGVLLDLNGMYGIAPSSTMKLRFFLDRYALSALNSSILNCFIVSFVSGFSCGLSGAVPSVMFTAQITLLFVPIIT